MTARSRAALVALLALVVLIAAVRAPVAYADADPPSDVLFQQDIYLPYGPKPQAALVTKLRGAVAATKRAHRPVRVALIASRLDLGGVPALFGKPALYARFLGAELQFVFHGTLLVVMPQGFGVSRGGRELRSAEAWARPIRIGQGADGLAQAAIAALHRIR